MKAALIRALARMPARQLHLVLGGSLAVALALLWVLGLRAPLAKLRLQDEERARLVLAVRDPAMQQQQFAVLDSDIKVLRAALKMPHAGVGTDQLQGALIGALDGAATRHGVRVASVSPGPFRMVARFREVPFDLEASGRYADLIEWMADIERTQPAIAIQRFDLRPAGSGGQLSIKLRVAAYLSAEGSP